MGKKLHQQRRGKGTNAYKKLPNTFDLSVDYAGREDIDTYGEVKVLFNHTGHTAPIMGVIFDDFSTGTFLAPEGIKIGSKIHVGPSSVYTLGSVLKLSEIPRGMPIYNIELKPRDGGKLVRSGGESAYISAQSEKFTTVVLPSKKAVSLNNDCRAQLGVVSGGGRKDQVIVKAGKSHYMLRPLNRMWPTARGVKMNPVDHPFGGKQHHKGKSSMTSRNAPPGRKVGHIAARRVGRKKK